MNEQIKDMDVEVEPVSGDLCSEQTRDMDRLYGEQSVNPAQSSDKPWLRNPEYFQRYVVCVI